MSNRPKTEDAERPARQPIRLTLLPTLAAVLWLPQAGLLAQAISNVADRMSWGATILPAATAAAIGILRVILGALSERAGHQHARARVSALRMTAIMALSERAPLDRRAIPSGEAASMIAEQADSITPWLARFGPARMKAVLVPLAIFLAILPLSWTAALVLLIAMPVIPVFMALIGWQAQAASKAQLVEIGAMNAFLLDRLRGLATIRGLGATDRVATSVRAEAEGLRARSMAVLRIAFLTSAVLELFAALGVAMVAVYVGFHLLGDLNFGAWGDTLSLAQGMFILLLAPAFFEPLRDLSAIWHDKAAGQAAQDNLLRLSRSERTLPEAGLGTTPSASTGPQAASVRVAGLRFRHGDDGGTLPAGLNFTLAAGEHLALTGPSGAGKTTLLALIAGLDLPQAGRIEIDCEALTAETATRLRARMAWIGQSPHIFAGSLAQNVTMGRKEIGPEKVSRALSDMHLGAMARIRGTAPIGEGGNGISGGEALRLALARIAVSPVRLVLADEPTAHLDLETAESVTESLLALAQGRSLIVATHDPRLAARMDRQISLPAPATVEAP
ncbi:thiol reductant ABC exporter subunit CydD [Paracoccus aminophilus]|uniref:ABC-type transport system involved in cytochrome bd biosynthesis, ATPase and permease component n=1 Tax=Paracoccus aminophilus JCM 7686 TaxID=1367847 RepID=S5Y807_PARAH|nr:thiol reductant ABC exporter subunit CydD [Paracoccus aminophilus]AGT11650.1 ABC-type transport system involved in cytochrome bd biosynthesis, ATPase and permease component [Paracoccus aminophilus JCM 7686]